LECKIYFAFGQDWEWLFLGNAPSFRKI